MEGLAGAESEERKAVLAPVGFITTGVKIAITLTETGSLLAEHIATPSQIIKENAEEGKRR